MSRTLFAGSCHGTNTTQSDPHQSSYITHRALPFTSDVQKVLTFELNIFRQRDRQTSTHLFFNIFTAEIHRPPYSTQWLPPASKFKETPPQRKIFNWWWAQVWNGRVIEGESELFYFTGFEKSVVTQNVHRQRRLKINVCWFVYLLSK